MGAADGLAASIVNGVVKGSYINAILISGDFSISSRGIGERFDGDPAVVSKNLLNQIKTELGGNPDTLFYVPGHPDTETGYTGVPKDVMFANMRQSVIDVFGNVPLVGHVGSSETGQKLTNSPVEAVIFTFFAVGIRATGVSPSGIASPQPTPSPTSSPAPSSTIIIDCFPSTDANLDAKTNLWDYAKWRLKLGQNLYCPQNGDFNSNHQVDISDFMFWIGNYP
jgi:hypothetical protein